MNYFVDPEATREDGVRIATIFSFTTKTPNLIVSDTNQLDRETRDEYRFRVTVSSLDGNDTAEVVIYLTDANDNDPNVTNSGWVCRHCNCTEHLCRLSMWCCEDRQQFLSS